MKKTGIIIVIVLFLFGGGLIGSYNGLVSMEENIDSKWAQVENQLQRRGDLIPNLVSTVKGYAAHEQEAIQSVADARARLGGASTPSEKATASSELTNAIGRLLMVAENYPNLKADANFRALQDELAGTENRLTVARQDYNNAIQPYNTKIRTFPTSIVAGMMGFEKKEYFEADEATRAVPKVSFE